MCMFFSCIVKRNKEVHWLEGESNHTAILEHYDIPDNTDDPLQMFFARIELLPPCGNLWEKNLGKWVFRIDERVTPEWFSPAHEEAARAALGRALVNIDTYFVGNLGLQDYAHPLPEGFTHCGGSLYLQDYAHPLPEGFTHCGGYLRLADYAHPLPEGFTHCGGYLRLADYAHPLPEGFTKNYQFKGGSNVANQNI